MAEEQSGGRVRTKRGAESMTYRNMSMASLLDASMDARRPTRERRRFSGIVLARLSSWDGQRIDLDGLQQRRLSELCQRGA